MSLGVRYFLLRFYSQLVEFSDWEEIYEYLKLSEIVEDEDENILANENLRINYRNRSAHVDIIEEENALTFYKEFNAKNNNQPSQNHL